MDKKTKPIYMLSTRNFRSKEVHSLKVNRWKKIFYLNGNKEKCWGKNTYIRQNRL